MATLKKIWVSPKYPRFFKTCMGKANVASILRAWDEPPHFLFFHSSERRARARLLSYYHHHAWADDENEEKNSFWNSPRSSHSLSHDGAFQFPIQLHTTISTIQLANQIIPNFKRVFCSFALFCKMGGKNGIKVELFFCSSSMSRKEEFLTTQQQTLALTRSCDESYENESTFK